MSRKMELNRLFSSPKRLTSSASSSISLEGIGVAQQHTVAPTPPSSSPQYLPLLRTAVRTDERPAVVVGAPRREIRRAVRTRTRVPRERVQLRATSRRLQAEFDQDFVSLCRSRFACAAAAAALTASARRPAAPRSARWRWAASTSWSRRNSCRRDATSS